MHRFNEWHPRFEGFSELYENEIRGGLKARDPIRRRALIEIAVLLGVVIPVGVAFVLNGHFIIGVILIGVAAFLAVSRVEKIKSEAKTHLMGPLCERLGLSFSAEATSQPLSHFESLHLIPSHDSFTTEDEVRGEHQGVPFFLIEADLFIRVRRSGDKPIGGRYKNKRVFRGLLIYMTCPKPFRGRVIVVEDAGWLLGLLGGLGIPGERIELEDPRFEKIFDVFGTDQVEARYLLTPRFMERLVELSRSVGHGKLQLAFDEDKLMIALSSTEDQFEAGGFFTGLDNPERVQAVIDQIGRIFRIIEVLDLDTKTRA